VVVDAFSIRIETANWNSCAATVCGGNDAKRKSPTIIIVAETGIRNVKRERR